MSAADHLIGRVIQTEHGPYKVIGDARGMRGYVELEAVDPPALGGRYRLTVRRADHIFTSLGIAPVTEPVTEPETRVVHCKKEPYDVYIGRSSDGLGWGNPYSHQEGTGAQHVVPTRDDAVAAYRAWMESRLAADEPGLADLIRSLHGKTLGCWCAPKACHGDVLADLAEQLTTSGR